MASCSSLELISSGFLGTYKQGFASLRSVQCKTGKTVYLEAAVERITKMAVLRFQVADPPSACTKLIETLYWKPVCVDVNEDEKKIDRASFLIFSPQKDSALIHGVRIDLELSNITQNQLENQDCLMLIPKIAEICVINFPNLKKEESSFYVHLKDNVHYCAKENFYSSDWSTAKLTQINTFAAGY